MYLKKKFCERESRKSNEADLLMKIITEIMEARGLGLREMARKLEISHQRLAHLIEGETKMSEFVAILCKLRRLYGGSWNDFGRRLDDEFYEVQKK